MVKKLYGKAGSPINIADEMFITALNVITSMLWGDSMPHGEEKGSTGAEFRLMVEEIVELLGKPNISDFFPALARFDLQGIVSKMKKLSLRFDQILESVIASRMNLPKGKNDNKDLLQFLLDLKHQVNDNSLCLSIEEIKALFVVNKFVRQKIGGFSRITVSFVNLSLNKKYEDIIVGASDTSSTTVEWAMAEMLKHPDKMQRACEELDSVVRKQDIVDESHFPKLTYVDACIRETLRLHPPLPLLIPHCPARSCCVAGYTIPEGSRILINTWAMHRDPGVWENAVEFEPERFLKEPGNGDFHGNYFSYLPFGSGRRICPGIPIAEKMTKYVVATLLHCFDWKVPDEMELDMSEKFGIVLKKTTPLVATPAVRLPSLEQYL